MKKLLIVFLAVFICVLSIGCSFSSCSNGCKKENPLTLNVSSLRLDVFQGENENYVLSLFPETRENPLVLDGKIGEFEKVVIVKLKIKGEDIGSYSVNFATDKQYVANFSFNAFSDCYTTTILVEKLPDKPIIATISHNEKQENVTLNSLKKQDTVSSDAALKNAYEFKKDYVDSLTVNKAFNGEIIIKLMSEKEKNYWYVGFVTEEKTLAVLIDGKTGKALAEKTLLN